MLLLLSNTILLLHIYQGLNKFISFIQHKYQYTNKTSGYGKSTDLKKKKTNLSQKINGIN